MIQTNCHINPIPTLKSLRLSLKKAWIRTLIFADRMAIAKMYSELYNTQHREQVTRAIKGIGKSHAAKMRLLRQLSK